MDSLIRKLFDIRFSDKHCNFSRGYLLVKMASKTVIRPIVSGVKTTSVMLKTTKKTDPCYQGGNVRETLQLLNFHISRK